jgi:flagellar motor switch protein FliN/FliY
MSTETENQDKPAEDVPADDAAQRGAAADGTEAGNVEVSSPEFQEMTDQGQSLNKQTDLNRFQDIKVNVSADLGRAEVPIQTLMSLGEGSVLELNREIDSPVELVAQGVPLACGEVVVVNGCFAIRVTKVYEDQK